MLATASASAFHIDKLPPRLLRFFAKYPPQIYSARVTGEFLSSVRPSEAQPTTFEAVERPPSENSSPIAIASNTSADISNNPTSVTTTTPPPPGPNVYNPFLPHKNYATGRWRGAVVGLRRQAELVKLAKQHGVESLLPPGRKSTAFKEDRIVERGLRVKGTGEGQKVKGHIWERKLQATVEKRIKAMEDMPEMIRLWKQRGHGRGWKKYPK